MGISEEIEVATIAIDDQIAIPIKVDNASRAVTAKKSAKKCAARSEFLFCLLNLLLFWFAPFRRLCGCAELASRVTTQNKSWYATILPDAQRN